MPSAQEEALKAIWDPETGCLISWEEQQAREASAKDMIPGWVKQDSGDDQFGLGLKNAAVNCPTRGGFIIDIDNQCHDTFGLGLQGVTQGSNVNLAFIPAVADALANQQPYHPTTFTIPTFNQAPAPEDDITLGELIIDARVAAIEVTVANLADSISTLLLHLQQQASSSAAPPTGANETIPPMGV